MITKTIQNRSGLTIIEAMVAITVLSVALIGTSAYEYGAAMDAHKADLNTTGIRMALLLCEGWAGEGGDANFNPFTEFEGDLNITAATGPAVPTGFTKLNSCRIIVNNTSYFATLSWKDSGTSGLKAINVLVQWDQHSRVPALFANTNKTYQLTTYAKKQSS